MNNIKRIPILSPPLSADGIYFSNASFHYPRKILSMAMYFLFISDNDEELKSYMFKESMKMMFSITNAV